MSLMLYSPCSYPGQKPHRCSVLLATVLRMVGAYHECIYLLEEALKVADEAGAPFLWLTLAACLEAVERYGQAAGAAKLGIGYMQLLDRNAYPNDDGPYTWYKMVLAGYNTMALSLAHVNQMGPAEEALDSIWLLIQELPPAHRISYLQNTTKTVTHVYEQQGEWEKALLWDKKVAIACCECILAGQGGGGGPQLGQNADVPIQLGGSDAVRRAAMAAMREGDLEKAEKMLKPALTQYQEHCSASTFALMPDPNLSPALRALEALSAVLDRRGGAADLEQALLIKQEVEERKGIEAALREALSEQIEEERRRMGRAVRAGGA